MLFNYKIFLKQILQLFRLLGIILFLSFMVRSQTSLSVHLRSSQTYVIADIHYQTCLGKSTWTTAFRKGKLLWELQIRWQNHSFIWIFCTTKVCTPVVQMMKPFPRISSASDFCSCLYEREKEFLFYKIFILFSILIESKNEAFLKFLNTVVFSF